MVQQRHTNGWLTVTTGHNWLGHYNVYVLSTDTGKEVRHHKSVVLGPKSTMRKWEAEEKLREVIQRHIGVRQGTLPNPNTTLVSFVVKVYIPMRSGGWSQPTATNNTYMIQLYILKEFGERKLENIGAVELQLFINALAKKFCRSTVLKVLSHLRALMKLARKQRYIQDDPSEDLITPRTHRLPKPTMTKEDLARLIDAIIDPMDRCLMCIGCFCALRSAEVFGLIWSSYMGDHLAMTSTAYKSTLYRDNMKNNVSRDSVCVPDYILPYIEQWRGVCPDSSPDALMFSRIPTKGRNKDKVVPYDSFSYMLKRIMPIAKSLGIPNELVNFRVFRRTAGTDLQHYGGVKDIQSTLRHEDVGTTFGFYVQAVAESTRKAVNDRTEGVFACLARPLQPTATPQVGAATSKGNGKVDLDFGNVLDLQRHLRIAPVASALAFYAKGFEESTRKAVTDQTADGTARVLQQPEPPAIQW